MQASPPSPGVVDLHARYQVEYLDPDAVVMAAALQTSPAFDSCADNLSDAGLYRLAVVLQEEAHRAGWGLHGAYFLAAMVEGESGCRQWIVGGAQEVCILQIIPVRYERPPALPLQEDVRFCVRTAISILKDYRYNGAWGNRGTKRWWWGHYNGGNYCVIGYARRVAYRYRALLQAAGVECRWWDDNYPYEDQICRRR